MTPGSAGLLGANERNFRELVAQYRRFEGNVIPCVGAGLSVGVYPLWGQSLKLMASLIPHVQSDTRAQIEALIGSSRFDAAANLLFEAAGRSAFSDTLRQVFDPARATPEEVERLPAALLPKAFPEGPVLTLNFDCLLENFVYRGSDHEFGDRVIRGPVQFTQDRQDLVRGGVKTLLKIHGCVTRPSEVVFTSDQYDRFYHKDNNSPNAAFLALLFQAHPVLFLGCSLTNDRLMQLLTEIARTNDLPHFALLPRPEDDRRLAEDGQRLANVGIRPIWYPTGQHQWVLHVLEALAAQRRRSAAPAVPRDEPAVAEAGSRNLCIGRDELIGEAWLSVSHDRRREAVEIQGAPGIGKSTICRAILDRAESEGWRTVEVPLSDVKTKAEALQAILSSCGTEPLARSSTVIAKVGPEPDASLELEVERISNGAGRTILYLDNMEDPQADADFTRWFVDSVERSEWQILYSTQTTIRSPNVRHLHVGPLGPKSAEELFAMRWGPVSPDESDSLSELVRVTDCHPLSLVLISGQRDRWQTVPEVLAAWTTEVDQFTMHEANYRHRSVEIALRLALDRVIRDRSCMELLALMAHVSDYLPLPIMNRALDAYPSLRGESADPLGTLLHQGLVESAVRKEPCGNQTAYRMLGPLKRTVLDAAGHSTEARAVARLAHAYEQVFEAARDVARDGGANADDLERLAASSIHQAWSLMASALGADPLAARTLMRAMRDHVAYLPGPSQLIFRQLLREDSIVVHGSHSLRGSTSALPSGRAAIPLILCALLNHGGASVLTGLPYSEEINSFMELLRSMGVPSTWSVDHTELQIATPERILVTRLNVDQARRTWSTLLVCAVFPPGDSHWSVPLKGGAREAAAKFTEVARVLRDIAGTQLSFEGDAAHFHRSRGPRDASQHGGRIYTLRFPDEDAAIVGILLAAQFTHETEIRNVPWCYAIGELCFFLSVAGIEVRGLGTSTLVIRGSDKVSGDLRYTCTEDPTDAMSLIVSAIATKSEISISRTPAPRTARRAGRRRG